MTVGDLESGAEGHEQNCVKFYGTVYRAGLVILRSLGRRFDSAPGHCRVTTLDKLFTVHTHVSLFTKQYNLVPVKGR